jgi:dTDP-4-dehydrorhamnose reductase
MNKKILLIGASGQLGLELQRTVPDRVELHSYTSSELDICDRMACIREVGELDPDIIINAAAYTDVENAETNSEIAFKVNRDGVENLAIVAGQNDSRLIHVSTDFVFAGGLRRPLTEEDEPNPINEYGKSKLAGEKAIQGCLFEDGLIIRTSWLYSPNRKNFVKTILQLLRDKPFLNVIKDQVGVPTSTRSLAHVIYKAAELELAGLYHWCDAGSCSWYEFACEIQNQALEQGLLKEKKEIIPIAAANFPAKAPRPEYSVMSQKKLAHATQIDPLPWQNELKLVLNSLFS